MLAGVYVIATVLFLPGLILTLGAGFAFNQAYNSVGLAMLVGTLSVWVGASIGATIAFLLGRYVFRSAI